MKVQRLTSTLNMLNSKKKGRIICKSNLDYKILRLANVYDQDKKGIVKNIINSIIKKKIRGNKFECI